MMTAKELEAIVAGREMSRLELKESFDKECIETVAAFANASGGYLVIGVTNSGELASLQLREESLRDYENRITTATEPVVSVELEKVVYRGGEVVVARVQENPLKPIAVKGRCFIRRGSVNHQMTPTEIAECHLKSTGGSMDAVSVPGATRDDLNMEVVRHYMAKAVESGRRDFDLKDDPWQVLRKLEFVKNEDEISRAMILLFGKNPQRFFPSADVRVAVLRCGSLMIDSRVIQGNLISQIDEVQAFVRRSIKVRFEISGKPERDEYWDYPLDALRETITNAICHRDYGIANDIQIKIFEDHLRVWNPGRLPFDMPISLLMDPDHSSRPRNRIIAQVFYDMKLIERYGSGIDRIAAACRDNGNALPEWKEEPDGFVTIYRERGDGSINGSINEGGGTINGTINGKINGNESCRKGGDSLNSSQIEDFILPHDTADGKINGTINNGSGSINGSIKYEYVDGLTRNEEKILSIVRSNPGCKRDEFKAQMSCSERTIIRCVANLIAGNILEYRGSKKTGGYYLIEKA